MRCRALIALSAALVLAAGCSAKHPGATGTPVDAGSPPPSSSVLQGLPGPEGVPVPTGPPLADLSAAATGQTVDSVPCNVTEQLVYHIHAHLSLFVDGAPRQVPGGIGIPGGQAGIDGFVGGTQCYYWLHTHAADGVIHIESPVQHTFPLGTFFDIWGQPLVSGGSAAAPAQVGPVTGTVTAYVNGLPYRGDLRSIPLAAHTQVQIDVGSPAPGPETVPNWGHL